MKRLLLAPFLFLLAGCQSNPTQWPTSWSQFDPPPSKKARPFITVKFLDSIEEACKEFKKAEKLEDLFQKKYDAITEPLIKKYRLGTLTDEEWKEKTTAAYQALWPRKLKRVSTAVEVLRQAEYPDWKLYSRYNLDGVGDLWRKEAKKKGSLRDSPNYKYVVRSAIEAGSVCGAIMP